MIRVLIERKVAESMESAFHKGLREARQSAVGFPGYISGETLRDVDNSSHHVIISTWRSVNDWNRWLASDERMQVEAAIGPCLDEPETHLVMEPM
jgi:heme-degrading monooxygenase HmoA